MLKRTNVFGDLTASGVITVTLDDTKVQAGVQCRDDRDEVLR